MDYPCPIPDDHQSSWALSSPSSDSSISPFDNFFPSDYSPLFDQEREENTNAHHVKGAGYSVSEVQAFIESSLAEEYAEVDVDHHQDVNHKVNGRLVNEALSSGASSSSGKIANVSTSSAVATTNGGNDMVFLMD